MVSRNVATEPIGTMSPSLLRVFRFATSRDAQAKRIVGLRVQLIGAAEKVEIVDVGRTHIDRQRIEHARRSGPASSSALVRSMSAINLRRVGVEQREGLGEARVSALPIRQRSRWPVQAPADRDRSGPAHTPSGRRRCRSPAPTAAPARTRRRRRAVPDCCRRSAEIFAAVRPCWYAMLRTASAARRSRRRSVRW